MKGRFRLIIAGLLGIGVTLLINALGIAWLRGSAFASDSFYDGSALFLTLAIPGLLGGVLIGLIARAGGLNTAALTYALFCLAGVLHPFWQIPRVSPHSVHSGLMHYFLYNPLVALAFGALGGWGASQFATGQWTLADREPVAPFHLDD